MGSSHQHGSGEVRLLAAPASGTAAAQRRGQADAGHSAVVKFGLEVLQIQRKVQDVRVRLLHAGAARSRIPPSNLP